MRAQSLLTLLPLALLLATPLPAAASQVFPEAVKAAVPSLECVPQCTLCHQTNPGMVPANKPFANNLKAAGLAANSPVAPQNTASLRGALMALSTATSDGDMDTITDFNELIMSQDPNDATVGAELCEVVPLYGCGATIAAAPAKRTSDPTAAITAVLTAVAGVLVLRRRRR